MEKETGKENFIPLSEVSKKTGYSPEYLNSLCRQGKLEGLKIGRNWFTTEKQLDKFLSVNHTNHKGGGASIEETNPAVKNSQKSALQIMEEESERETEKNIQFLEDKRLGIKGFQKVKRNLLRPVRNFKNNLLENLHKKKLVKAETILREKLEEKNLGVDNFSSLEKRIFAGSSLALALLLLAGIYFLPSYIQEKIDEAANRPEILGINSKENPSSGVTGKTSASFSGTGSGAELNSDQILSGLGIVKNGNNEIAGDIKIRANGKVRIKGNAVTTLKIRNHTIKNEDLNNDMTLKVESVITTGNIVVGGNFEISGTQTNTGLVTFNNGITVAHGNVLLSTNGTITQTGTGQTIFNGNLDANAGLDVLGGNLTVGGTNFQVDVATGNITTQGDIDAATGTITTLGGTTLTYTTGNLTTANITTLDLGTNTIYDGNFTGDWNFNAGDLSNIGTISSGNITGGTYNGNTITTGTGTLSLNSYTLALSGNSQINQNLLTTSAPTFSGLTLTGFSGILKATAGIISGSATTTDLPEGTNLYYLDSRARASISETITGISYDNITGIFSLTANYVIPTTTEESNWNDAYAKRVDTWNYPLAFLANAASLNYNTTNFQLTANALNTIQDIATTSSPTFVSLNTGQGAYELYAMDQNMLTTSSPTFAGLTLNGDLTLGANTLTTSNTNLVANLNADLLDSQHGAYYAPLGNINGTTNYVAKFTGANSIGNSLIYDTGTRIGIGLNLLNPQTRLDVEVFGGGDIITYGPDRMDTTIRGVLGYLEDGDTTMWLANKYNSDAARFGIRMKGSAATNEVFSILGNGYVGIGDSSPAALFTVGNGDKFQVDALGNIITAGTSLTLSGASPVIDLTSATTLSINTTTNRPVTFGSGLVTANNFGSSSVAITGGAISNTTIGLVNPSTGAFTTLTSSGNTTLGTGASGTHTFSTGAGSITTLGNSTGALTIASGGTSSWTNTSGNLTIQTATSGTLALTSAGALNLTAGSASTNNITGTYLINSSGVLSLNTSSNAAITTGTGLFTTGGSVTVNGNAILGTNSANTLTINSVVSSDIIPEGSNRSLGSNGTRWDFGYFDDIVANNLTGVIVTGSTTSASWTINSDNATNNAEIASLVFKTGTAPINAVLQWNAANDVSGGKVAGFDNSNLFNFPIAIYSEVNGGNQTFTSGSLFKFSQPASDAITQSGAFIGFNLDLISNISVPDSANGNQTGVLASLQNGGASAMAIGFQTAGTMDYGLDIGGTIGTADIRLSNGETIDNLTNGTILLTAATTSTGLITGNTGLTVTGAAVNLNNTSNFATNINTGTSTGTVSIGNALADVAITDGQWSVTGLGAATFTSVNAGTGSGTFDSLSVGGGYGSSGVTISNIGAISADGLITGVGGITFTGTANLNATGTAATNIGNATGILTLASGGVSSWTNTAGNLTISTATSGNLILDSAAALNLGATNATSVSLSRTGITTTVNGALTATQLLTGNLGATISGAVISLNNTSNFATNINTGTSTGTVSIGNALADVAITSNDWGITSIGAATGFASYNGLIITPDTGAITTGSWHGTVIDADHGGTGQTIYAVGDLLYASTTTALSKLADVAVGSVLISGGVNMAPGWGTIGASGITADSLDFTEFQDTLDLDANLILNQTAYTWTQNFTGDSTTGLTYNANSLTTGTAVSLVSTSTAGGASGSSYLLNLARSGANASASHSAYGIYSNVINTGATSTNIAGYFSASGATNNQSLYVNSAAAGANNYTIYAAGLAQNFFAGNVGIGTTGPSEKLHIANGNIRLASTGNWIGDSSANAFLPYANAGADAQINAAGDVVLNPTGNVGIGTTAPIAQLNVNGVGQTTAAITDAGVVGGTIFLNDSGNAAGNGGAILFGGINNTKWFTGIKGLLVNGDANTVGDLAFSTRNATGDTALTERMRILSTGNVGIGTTNPGAKLDITTSAASDGIIINGNNNSGPALKIKNAVTSGHEYWWISNGSGNSGGVGAFQLWDNTDAATRMVVLPTSGNVGIGTTTPGSLLEISAAGAGVTKGIKISNTSDASQKFRIWGSTTPDAGLITFGDGTGWKFHIGKDSDSGATKFVTVLDTGNVGIGTTDPGAKLEVKGATVAQSIIFDGIANNYIAFRESTNDKAYLGMGPGIFGSGLAGSFGIRATGALQFGTGGDNIRMTIDSTSGNVGIGTTNPLSKLDVFTDSSAKYAAKFFNDGNNVDRYGILIQAGEDTPVAGVSTLAQFNDGDGTAVGSITFNGTQTFYNTTSDARLKNNIVDTSLGINNLMNIKVRDFEFKSDPSQTVVHGFIAQELNAVYPQAVTAFDDARYWQVDYSKLMPLAIKSIQEQQGQISNLVLKTDSNVTTLSGLQASVDSNLLVIGEKINKMDKSAGDYQNSVSSEIAKLQKQIDDIITVQSDYAVFSVRLDLVESQLDLLNTIITYDPISQSAVVLGDFKIKGELEIESLKTGAEMSGKSAIKFGETEVEIKTINASKDNKIYITPTTKLNGRSLWVDEKDILEGVSFKVKLDGEILLEDATFNWIIVK